jgi:hypothetical protein
MENKQLCKRGRVHGERTGSQRCFIPEEFDEEQKMIAETCRDFLDTEVMPNLERIDMQEEGFVRGLAQ